MDVSPQRLTTAVAAFLVAVAITSVRAQEVATPVNPLRQHVEVASKNSEPEENETRPQKAVVDSEVQAASYETQYRKLTSPRVRQTSHGARFSNSPGAPGGALSFTRTGHSMRRHAGRHFGYSPPHAQYGTSILTHSEGEIMEGEVIYEGTPEVLPKPMAPGEVFHEGPIPDGMISDGMMMGPDCCGGSGCLSCCVPCFDNFEFMTGVDGFTGPKNRGGSGSFGFHYGLNWSAPMICSCGSLGMQLGARGVHSNYSGTSFSASSRDQLFVTGGVFRRVDWGLQGGAVVDYQYDSWYTETNLLQLRGEISWMCPSMHELGFWFTTHLNTETTGSTLNTQPNPVIETWEATDLYAFFYRHRFLVNPDASCRVFAGFTNRSDGLIGSEVRIPLSNCFALESGFAYLVPNQSSTGLAGGGHEQESWNIGINLVWYPGARSACGNDYYRPLFNVADNGTFMVDLRN